MTDDIDMHAQRDQDVEWLRYVLGCYDGGIITKSEVGTLLNERVITDLTKTGVGGWIKLGAFASPGPSETHLAVIRVAQGNCDIASKLVSRTMSTKDPETGIVWIEREPRWEDQDHLGKTLDEMKQEFKERLFINPPKETP